jgi:hypothetical protein
MPSEEAEMAIRMRPPGDSNPLHAYAPAFDLSNALPALCKGCAVGLLEENWPAWMHAILNDYADAGVGRVFTQEDLHRVLLLYIRSLKVMQTDSDVPDVAAAYARAEFDKTWSLHRAVVMARLAEYVTSLFLVAIKDATRLEEGGTPVRADIAAAIAEVAAMITPRD